MAFSKLSGALLRSNPLPVVARANVETTIPFAPVRNLVERSQLAELLKQLKLTAVLRDYETLARECAVAGVDHAGYLLRVIEAELTERKRLMIARRMKQAQFPTIKTLEGFDFGAIPDLDQNKLRELGDCGYISRFENVIVVGDHGTGKTHIGLALGFEACQRGLSVRFTTLASLAHELIEASEKYRLTTLQRRLSSYALLIVDDLGYASLPAGAAELIFEVLSQRCERGSTVLIGSLSTPDWARVFGYADLTRALLDRLTHRAHFMELRGPNYRQRLIPQAIAALSPNAAHCRAI